LRKKKKPTRTILDIIKENEELKRFNKRLVTYMIARELSRISEILASLTKEKEYREKFVEYRDTFESLSWIVIRDE